MFFSLSSSWRKSLYFVALSQRLNPSAPRAQSTSASATMFSDSRRAEHARGAAAGADAGDVHLLVGRLVAERLQRWRRPEPAARDDPGEQRAEKEVPPRDAFGHRGSFPRRWACRLPSSPRCHGRTRSCSLPHRLARTRGQSTLTVPGTVPLECPRLRTGTGSAPASTASPARRSRRRIPRSAAGGASAPDCPTRRTAGCSASG